MAPRSVARLATRNVLYASIAGDLLVAAIKFGAAFFTGSSAMWSEAVHSLVDSSNSILLLYGVHRSKRTPDQNHPFGYGREIYFWSFVVAVQVFALGAGVAFVQGVTHVVHPSPIEFANVNYVVLALSALFDGATWLIALRGFKGETHYADIFRAIRASKDPPSFMVVFEDSAALIGLFVAFAGSYVSESESFTFTHARRIASKVATDLLRFQRFYGSPSDASINDYETELAIFLKYDAVASVEYGFQRNGLWTSAAVRYTALPGGTLCADDDPGKIRPGIDVASSTFTSFLTYSSTWFLRPAVDRERIGLELPFQRSTGSTPNLERGYWANDLNYVAGGRGLGRSTVRS